MSGRKVQWMWGDASILGHSAARWNPMRWSARLSFDEAIKDLELCHAEDRKRPVDIRVLEIDHVTYSERILTSQHLLSVEEAVARLRELRSPGAPGYGDATRSRSNSMSSSSPCKAGPESGAAMEATRSDGDHQNLAGMLEKQSRWKKEWAQRFFVMRPDRIDYYLAPPTLMEDEKTSEKRGSISLTEAVAAVDENGRPYCISVGGELLGCQNLAEQQRWLQTINEAAAALARTRLPAEDTASTIIGSLKASKLWLLPPDASEDVVPITWKDRFSVNMVGSRSSATLLFAAGAKSSTDARCPSGQVQATCRLSLFDVAPNSSAKGVVRLLTEGEQESSGDLILSVKVYENRLQAAAKSLSSYAEITCVLAIAMLLVDNTRLALFAVIALAAMLFYEAQQAPVPSRRLVTFSVEKIESVNREEPAEVLAPLTTTPGWIGKWVLDKTRSEPYAPILKDIGVSYLLRKAADAAKSQMTISTTEKDVLIQINIWVTVEDCIPLDGSFVTKDVPTGSKMTGKCKVRLTKISESELEMFTVFPDGYGTLRDTLVMHEDGNTFSRTVVKGPLKVTRVFRRFNS